MSMLEVKGLQKTYVSRFGGNRVEALKNVNFTVEEGEYVAIMGESRLRQDDAAEHAGRARSSPTGRQRAAGRQGALSTLARAAISPPSAATIWALCFRSSTCWTPFPSRTTSTCRWCWRVSPTPKCAGASRPWRSSSASTHLLKKYPLRGFRRAEAACRRGSRADHRAAHPCWPTSRPARWIPARRTSCCACSIRSTPTGRPS